jgi:hypothetical protein
VDWFEKSLSKERLVKLSPSQEELTKLLIGQAKTGKHFGLSLAAAFDLLVAVEYYSKVVNTGWLYCPSGDEPLFLYPFTNACPCCLLKGEFHFHKANKPESGAIGAATRNLLCGFLQHLFAGKSRDLKIYLGYEPVDVLIHDELENIILLAEVKAAPLTTLALAVQSEHQTITENGEVTSRPHSVSDNSSLGNSHFKLLLPISKGDAWSYELVDLGIKGKASTKEWFYEQAWEAISKDESLFSKYFDFWQKAFLAYNKKEKTKDASHDVVYWLTNACGAPSPIPSDWPRNRNQKSYESISDSKSSVGMDRTDDIKKGTYQVLKLATSGKPKQKKYTVKTALISNIHAVRHYNEYLRQLQDVVWTIDKTKTAKRVGDLPAEQEVYNLFDGIISFTESYARDEWIASTFKF